MYQAVLVVAYAVHSCGHTAVCASKLLTLVATPTGTAAAESVVQHGVHTECVSVMEERDRETDAPTRILVPASP